MCSLLERLKGLRLEKAHGLRVRDTDGPGGARPWFCFRIEVYQSKEASETSSEISSGLNLDGRHCSPWDSKPLHQKDECGSGEMVQAVKVLARQV